ncbi:hypothetical protein VA7868_03924 [Vibrio aerogenes CECT 7868]|uniref:Uncharacterized protein n=1 Tax=Vibrio aerogenes CECT 7868 TaxID=1216006 RepID=A0A1M6C1Z0_9VIBR|nr:phage tail tube protein [Vibrio aerogenes]SHI54962.1 hypothetical protein VA7868_03924 [Vibrio aerogenes CECT 7868]
MADASRHQMSLVPESTYGVTPDSPEFTPIRHTGTTLALTKNTMQSEEIRADRQIADFHHSTSQVGGDISTELSFGSFDQLLEASLLGSWKEDAEKGNDSLKAGTTRRSFSVLRHFSDLAESDKPYHMFTGVEVNSLNLQVTPDAVVSATFSMVGKGLSTATQAPAGMKSGTATTTSVINSFTGTLKEGGEDIGVVTEIQLTLENGIDPRFIIGSKETMRPQIGRSNLSGQMTAYFESASLLDKFINETETSLEFTLPDDAGNAYTFVIPRIKYNGGQPDVSGQGSIQLTLPFQALFDETQQSNIVIKRKAA